YCAERAFRPSRRQRRSGISRSHHHCRRSSISAAALHQDLRIQEADRRLRLESDSLFRAVVWIGTSEGMNHRDTKTQRKAASKNVPCGLSLCLGVSVVHSPKTHTSAPAA